VGSTIDGDKAAELCHSIYVSPWGCYTPPTTSMSAYEEDGDMSEPTAEDAVELRQKDVFYGTVSLLTGVLAFTPMSVDPSTPRLPQSPRPDPLIQTPLPQFLFER
jgi:hypothetical protein